MGIAAFRGALRAGPPLHETESASGSTRSRAWRPFSLGPYWPIRVAASGRSVRCPAGPSARPNRGAGPRKRSVARIVRMQSRQRRPGRWTSSGTPLASGGKIRALSIVDIWSEVSPAVDPRFIDRREDAVRPCDEVCAQLCCPKTNRVDPGSAFVDRDLWACRHRIALDASRPGIPTDNAYVEALKGKSAGSA